MANRQADNYNRTALILSFLASYIGDDFNINEFVAAHDDTDSMLRDIIRGSKGFADELPDLYKEAMGRAYAEIDGNSPVTDKERKLISRRFKKDVKDIENGSYTMPVFSDITGFYPTYTRFLVYNGYLDAEKGSDGKYRVEDKVLKDHLEKHSAKDGINLMEAFKDLYVKYGYEG